MELILPGVGAPFTMALAVPALAGLIVTSPIWLYQVWAFIVPGLLPRRRSGA